MPSQAEIQQHQQDVEEVSALAITAVTAVVLAASHDGEDPDGLVKSVRAALEPFLIAAAELATDWYRRLALRTPTRPVAEPGAPDPITGPTDRISLLDAQDFDPRPAPLPPREQIESSVWWALYEPPEPSPVDTAAAEPEDLSAEDLVAEVRRLRSGEPPALADPSDADIPRARVVPASEPGAPGARVVPADGSPQQARVIARLSGAVQRYVTTAARDTVTSNAEREGVRWMRDAQPDACAFCRMLATRGTIGSDEGYLSEESAKFVVGRRGRERGSRKIGELYHDVCRCEPVAVRAGGSYDPPEHLIGWQEQYEKAVVAVGNSADTKAILREMRAAEKERGGSNR